MDGKDLSVEALRGFALVLLVGFHAVGPTMTPETEASAIVNLLAHIGEGLSFVRMPLFTVISGYIYARRPVARGDSNRFLTGKARRLLIPMVVVVVVTLALRALSEPDGLEIWGVVKALPESILWRFEHLWFVQSIFLVFVVVTALELNGQLANRTRWAAITGAAAAGAMFPISVTFFSLDGALYLLPFFLLGLGLNRFYGGTVPSSLLATAGVVTVVGLTLQQVALAGWLDLDVDRASPLGIMVGLATATLLLAFRQPVGVLAKLGGFSYTVYLYHLIGMAIASRLLGNSPTELLVAAEFACGLALGVVLQLGCSSRPVGRVVLLGLRPRPRSGLNPSNALA